VQHKSKLGSKLFVLALAFALPIVVPGWAKGNKDSKDKKEALSPEAKAGKKLFDDNCSPCHFDDQTATKVGPGLKGLFKMKGLPFSHRPVTEANVRAQIENGNPTATPMPMPPFGSKLSKSDVDALIAYLKTL
jgi:mono/diheme cytochrome c family protein